ncbi:Tumor suppressing sub-chromosomal transferable candidate [Melia azedarach]|uniref:Tumor suppressing sub-chromosomal transferable candidate n=1 Tax=Melia azedarach TaxID=155640 RepID=A0ACC1Z1E8_MELAZ|nr:Tumor suppressing sub-chromosomal transferable candidate [Melia azedarach]
MQSCRCSDEEEEDQYDKVAVGKEKAGERLYMKDINDYETDADSFNELPNSFKEALRDPRANHIAAKLRLKEDAEAAKKINSLQVSKKDAPSDITAQINTSADGNLKPILKRGDMRSDSRPQKRVRFDSECVDNLDHKEDFNEKSEEGKSMVTNEEFPSGIPDYMRNPTKYTCYTLDSDDIDDKSNRQAYMDFLNMLKKSKTTEMQLEDHSSDLPKAVTFIPRKKRGDATMAENDTKSKQNQDDTCKDSGNRKGLPISIAAGDEDNGEVCAMEEDKPEAAAAPKISGSQGSGRQYRMRDKADME